MAGLLRRTIAARSVCSIIIGGNVDVFGGHAFGRVESRVLFDLLAIVGFAAGAKVVPALSRGVAKLLAVDCCPGLKSVAS